MVQAQGRQGPSCPPYPPPFATHFPPKPTLNLRNTDKLSQPRHKNVLPGSVWEDSFFVSYKRGCTHARECTHSQRNGTHVSGSDSRNRNLACLAGFTCKPLTIAALKLTYLSDLQRPNTEGKCVMVQFLPSPAVLMSSVSLVIPSPQSRCLEPMRGPDGCGPIIQTTCFLFLESLAFCRPCSPVFHVIPIIP